ncbi:MAG TPA: hypothetical protein VE987_00320 [Polyangiaceae bacterium]|nr:hypothetical protein [Polyangiaceae bacterium]
MPNAMTTGEGASRHDGAGTTARQVHDDIEQTLQARSAKGRVSERIEDALKSRGQRAWSFMKRHPLLSVIGVAVGGFAAAAEIGVAEVAFGSALAFAAYKVLREGEPPIQALEEAERDVGV